MRSPVEHKLPRWRTPGAAAVLLAAITLAGCGQRKAPAPHITFVYSNDLRGEIRSCGCAEHDMGGLGRHATFLRAVSDTTGDVLLVDAGDFFASSITYGVEKADVTLKSMGLMGYQGVVIGEDELGFGLDFILRRAREARLPIVVANLFDAAADTLVFPASRIVALPSGLRVGIIGVMSANLVMPPQVPRGSLEVRDPLATVQPEVDRVRGQADLVVLLAHMQTGEAQNLARSLHGVGVVFVGHDGRHMRKLSRSGDAYVLQAPERGLYMGLAYATLGPEGRIASMQDGVIAMDKRFADDEAISRLFQAYDFDIAAKEKAILPTGITNARNLAQRPFVGADACRECHESIHDAWSETKHAHAWETLTDLKREYDRDCTPCHTVGFYKNGGFENVVTTPHLTGVQCESCHGNGAEHAENPDMKTGTVARTQCQGCHTAEQSPDFVFETFWKRIDHGREAAPAGASNGR